MPQDVHIHPTSGRLRAQAIVETAADRDKAFRKARRHTLLVRTLRLVLPVAAILMLGSYGLFMRHSFKIGTSDKSIEVSGLSISREALVAHDPRYRGFDKDGGGFEVKAKKAEQDIKQRHIVRLTSIEGTMTDAALNRTALKAVRGVFDTNTNVLEMSERIDVATQSGMSAELTEATVDTRQGRIVSGAPVMVRMPTGTVRGQSLAIEQRTKQVLFAGGVVAHLSPQPKSAAAAAAEPPAQRPRPTASLAGSGAPVDVTSARLLIDDVRKTATFTGDVVARQQDQTLETPELEVTYEGQPAGAGQKARAAAPGQQGKLKQLVARQHVVVTRGQERATGSSAVFDAASDTASLMGPVVIEAGPERGATADRADIDNASDIILLTGNVVLTQQKNVLKGRLLQANRQKGTVHLSAPAASGLPKGQISARLYQADADAAKRKPATGASPAAKAASPLGLDMRGDPGQPVDIDADTLDVDDARKTATFRGKVKAVQGSYTITTEELVARYEGEAGLSLSPGSTEVKPAAGQARPAAQLQKIIAPRRVEIAAADGRKARGNAAEFDPKTNTAMLTGNVDLVQGTTIVAGECALLDMTSGQMRIIDACGYRAKPGAVAAKAKPQVTKSGPGRVQMMLFPGQLKEEQEKARREASPASAAAPASPAAAKAAPPATTPSATPTAPARPTRQREPESFSPFGN